MSDESRKATARQTRLTIKPSINTLAQGSMFWQPSYLEHSEWLEHLPFLFWLVEAIQPRGVVTLGTQQGVEHLAVCQAVSRLGLDSRCHVVQSLKGQGEAGNPVLDSVVEYNERNYGAFANVVDCPPLKASDQFNDGSVDLLLLNIGTDEIELGYVFDRWRSKLSSRGVVLIPSVARRDPGYSAFREFDALLSRFPGFAFHHGGGLGLIMVGEQPEGMLKKLLSSEESPPTQQVIRDVFARLGRTCLDAFNAREQKARADELDASLAEQQRQLEELAEAHEQNREVLQAREQELDDIKQNLDRQVEHHAYERGQLAERVSLLQEFRDDMKGELNTLRTKLEEQQRLQVESAQQVPRLFDEHHANAERVQHLEQELAERCDEVENLSNELQEKSQALEDQEQQLTALKQLEERMAEREREREEQESRFRELEQRLREKSVLLESQQKEMDVRFRELATLTKQLEESGKERGELRQVNEELKASLDECSRELETLPQQLEDCEKERDELRRINEKQKSSTDERFRELATLTQQLEGSEKERNELRRDNEEQKALMEEYFRESEMLAQELKDTEKEREELRRVNEEQKVSIDERFRELATLTQMLEQAKKGSNLPSRDETPAWTLNVDPRDYRLELYTKKRKSRKDKAEIERHRKVIASSPLFDAEWYLAQYPDVANDPNWSRDAARHYLLFGGYEGRNPGPEFDSNFYLASNADVLESGVNPLLHYMKFGEAEQRPVMPK
ncbi:hypothetical protein QC589_02305 [Halomonas elongata]|uniref:hypothetical protein n=1 Tax=Halomonas elongata TaxID=2746 RepID=UPI00335D9E7F